MQQVAVSPPTFAVLRTLYGPSVPAWKASPADVKSAIMTAREIYDELMGGRSQITAAAARVATDKDIQESLRDAIDDLRDAADRIQGKTSHSARNATLLMTGIVLGILFNPLTGPGTRRWLQDKVFGEGEEFEYRQDNAK